MPEPKTINPPSAKRVYSEHTIHDDKRVDYYNWLKDKENPEVIEHLKRENEYTSVYMKDTAGLQEKMFREFLSHIEEDDDSVPYKRGDWYYFRREEKGKNYVKHFRKKEFDGGGEQFILDENEIAAGLQFCSVMISPSPDGNILAYSVDNSGDHSRTIYFKDMNSGKLLEDTIEYIADFEWTSDSKSVYYIRHASGSIMKQVFWRTLGDSVDKDLFIYETPHDGNLVEMYKSSSNKYIVIDDFNFDCNEQYLLDAAAPCAKPVMVSPREKGVKYFTSDYDEGFFIFTNYKAPNYRVMKAPKDATSKAGWLEFIPESSENKIEEIKVFKKYIVTSSRENGVNQLRIFNHDGSSRGLVGFPEPVYTCGVENNFEYDTDKLRYYYISFVSPFSVWEFNMSTGEGRLLKENNIKNYNKSNFISERLFAKSRDGVMIPVSLLYKRGIKKDGTNPLSINAYGCYGQSSEVFFSSARLSILERGFIIAIAHVRGGGELGEQWYKDGKLLKKLNTFNDFIDVSEFLIHEGYTYKGGIAASGMSAGGMLMGGIANMRPGLFRCITALVPAVDVIESLLDPDVMNAKLHFDELGNPFIKEEYEYLKKYSPYDNVTSQPYPDMLITTGLHDIQVPFWEPTKFASKIREFNLSDNTILLQVRFESAHGGKSGKYEMYKDMIFNQAFMLKSFGITT